MQKIESEFKSEIEKEEKGLKDEQENLVAQKSVLSEEQFKEKQDSFRGKVNKTQTKIEGIRRELESTMARGMQIIQNEAIKQLYHHLIHHRRPLHRRRRLLTVMTPHPIPNSACRC